MSEGPAGKGSGKRAGGAGAGGGRRGRAGGASAGKKRSGERARTTGSGGKRRGRRAGGTARKRSWSGKWLERLLWIAVFGFVGWRLWPQVAAGLGVASESESAPGLAVRTLSGHEVSLTSLRGKVVLVNFWATWCPPCRAEIPGLEAVYRRHESDGFVILGLSTDQTGRGGVASFVRDHGMTYPVAMSTDPLEEAFGGIDALPSSFLIDRSGRIRYTVRGMFTEPALEQAVRRLLAEPASGASPATGRGEPGMVPGAIPAGAIPIGGLPQGQTGGR